MVDEEDSKLMRKIWVISDTHFGHSKMLSFVEASGKPAREFDDVQHMDDYMVERWNDTVSPEDKVYHLGDIVWKHSSLDIIKKLNGSIRLICGNHDIFGTKKYLEAGIKAVYGMKVIEDEGCQIVLTHCPVHDSVLREPRFVCNIHGHIHKNPTPDGYYFNASVENIDYTPILLSSAINKACKWGEATENNALNLMIKATEYAKRAGYDEV